jgi:hypothetical protein
MTQVVAILVVLLGGLSVGYAVYAFKGIRRPRIVLLGICAGVASITIIQYASYFERASKFAVGRGERLALLAPFALAFFVFSLVGLESAERRRGEGEAGDQATRGHGDASRKPPSGIKELLLLLPGVVILGLLINDSLRSALDEIAAVVVGLIGGTLLCWGAASIARRWWRKQ